MKLNVIKNTFTKINNFRFIKKIKQIKFPKRNDNLKKNTKLDHINNSNYTLSTITIAQNEPITSWNEFILNYAVINRINSICNAENIEFTLKKYLPINHIYKQFNHMVLAFKKISLFDLTIDKSYGFPFFQIISSFSYSTKKLINTRIPYFSYYYTFKFFVVLLLPYIFILLTKNSLFLLQKVANKNQIETSIKDEKEGFLQISNFLNDETFQIKNNSFNLIKRDNNTLSTNLYLQPTWKTNIKNTLFNINYNQFRNNLFWFLKRNLYKTNIKIDLNNQFLSNFKLLFSIKSSEILMKRFITVCLIYFPAFASIGSHLIIHQTNEIGANHSANSFIIKYLPLPSSIISYLIGASRYAAERSFSFLFYIVYYIGFVNFGYKLNLSYNFLLSVTHAQMFLATDFLFMSLWEQIIKYIKTTWIDVILINTFLSDITKQTRQSLITYPLKWSANWYTKSKIYPRYSRPELGIRKLFQNNFEGANLISQNFANLNLVSKGLEQNNLLHKNDIIVNQFGDNVLSQMNISTLAERFFFLIRNYSLKLIIEHYSKTKLFINKLLLLVKNNKLITTGNNLETNLLATTNNLISIPNTALFELSNICYFETGFDNRRRVLLNAYKLINYRRLIYWNFNMLTIVPIYIILFSMLVYNCTAYFINGKVPYIPVITNNGKKLLRFINNRENE